MLRRTTAVLAATALAVTLGACGNKQSHITKADTEAEYLDIAGLKYQVQVSRQLNAADQEDRNYLTGLRPQDRVLPPQTVWFAVFMRVENDSHKSIQTASDFVIEDTQANQFTPVPVDNTLAYKPELLRGGGFFPDVNSTAAYSPTQGTVLLFKVPRASLDNRPLQLTIKSPGVPQQEGEVDLDV